MEWYGKHYRKLFILPVLLLVISVLVIAFTVENTGNFVRKGVTLSGGVSATVTFSQYPGVGELDEHLEAAFPSSDVEVRSLNSFGEVTGYIIDAADISPDTQEAAEMLRAELESSYDVTSVSIETTGPSLGTAFFIQTIIGILLAFLWMGWVVFLYFGKSLKMKLLMALANIVLTLLVVPWGVITGSSGAVILALLVLTAMISYFVLSVPSGAVILAATSTIIFTLAIINLLQVRLSTAGVAAFLMIIGYSVDTDILLSTRVLKRHVGTLEDRIKGAFKTGITMQLTTSVAVLAVYFLTSSMVIKQIMLILIIGMVGDIIFTWFQNAGIIHWYVDRQPQPSHTVSVQQPVALGQRKHLRRRRRR